MVFVLDQPSYKHQNKTKNLFGFWVVRWWENASSAIHWKISNNTVARHCVGFLWMENSKPFHFSRTKHNSTCAINYTSSPIQCDICGFVETVIMEFIYTNTEYIYIGWNIQLCMFIEPTSSKHSHTVHINWLEVNKMRLECVIDTTIQIIWSTCQRHSLLSAAVVSAYANLLLDLIIDRINSRPWERCFEFPDLCDAKRSEKRKSVHFASHAYRWLNLMWFRCRRWLLLAYRISPRMENECHSMINILIRSISAFRTNNSETVVSFFTLLQVISTKSRAFSST